MLRAKCVRSVIKMPQNCCVLNCTKKVYREEDLINISFHKFPTNKDLLAPCIPSSETQGQIAKARGSLNRQKKMARRTSTGTTMLFLVAIFFYRFRLPLASAICPWVFEDAWIRAVRRDVGHHFRITWHTMVCSRHFKDSDFQKTLRWQKNTSSYRCSSIFPWKKGSPKKCMTVGLWRTKT